MTLFFYRLGTTFLHTLDVRCKCLLVSFLSLAVLKAGLWGDLLCLGLFIILLKGLGIGPVSLARQLKGFLFFLGLIFFSQWANTPGDPMFTLYGFSLSCQGLEAGGLVALGFLNVMLIGLVFTATTRTMEIKAAAQWFFRPVPFVPEKRVAVMMGLALKFIPLILENAREVTHAVNARCGNLRKNPVRRLINRTWPLLGKTFCDAENLSLAMQARCYSENRTDSQFYANGKEWLVMGLAFGFSVCIVWI